MHEQACGFRLQQFRIAPYLPRAHPHRKIEHRSSLYEFDCPLPQGKLPVRTKHLSTKVVPLLMDLNDPQANRPYTVIGSGPIPDDTTPDTLRLPFIQDYVCRSHVHPSLPDDRILVVELSPHRVDLHWKAGEVSKEFVRDNDELVRHTVRGLISVMVEPSAPDTVQVQDRVLERTEYHAELRPLDNFRNGSLARMTLRPGEVIWFVPEHHVSKAALNEINLAAEEFTTARFRFASLRATHHKLF